MIPVAIVDDHTLLRNALAQHINTLSGYHVMLEAGNGKSFIRSLSPENIPVLVLLDVLMPEMMGMILRYGSRRIIRRSKSLPSVCSKMREPLSVCCNMEQEDIL